MTSAPTIILSGDLRACTLHHPAALQPMTAQSAAVPHWNSAGNRFGIPLNSHHCVNA
jgi:hypothetical protein